MPNSDFTPVVTPFDIHSEVDHKDSKYWEVYQQLLELSKKDPPQGGFVTFQSEYAGRKAIETMTPWANADGKYIVFEPHRKGGRKLYLEDIPSETIGAEETN